MGRLKNMDSSTGPAPRPWPNRKTERSTTGYEVCDVKLTVSPQRSVSTQSACSAMALTRQPSRLHGSLFFPCRDQPSVMRSLPEPSMSNVSCSIVQLSYSLTNTNAAETFNEGDGISIGTG